MAFVNIPLAEAGQVANFSGGGGKGRGLQSYKVKSMDTGRPLVRAISTINLPQAVFIICHHLGRSREILHYFKFFHYHFSFCFSTITSEAGRQSERNWVLESMRSTFVPWLHHFWLQEPGQVSSAPQFPHCNSRTADNYVNWNMWTCIAQCLAAAELKP